MSKNIVLTGFMGAGKSVTARALADQLGMTLVSTDEQIIAAEGYSINEIFARNGEAYFRDVESRVVSTLSVSAGLVIDCGGGVVLRSENLDALKKNGVVIYLKTSPDVIYDRVKGDTHRPLLKVADPLAVIQGLLAQREPFYARADVVIDTHGKTAQQVAEEIVGVLKGESGTGRA